MADYITTFFSHFGAMRYKKEMDGAGLDALLMPVPRYLSSSCGTCVRINDVKAGLPDATHPDEIESIVMMTGPEEFQTVFRNI